MAAEDDLDVVYHLPWPSPDDRIVGLVEDTTDYPVTFPAGSSLEALRLAGGVLYTQAWNADGADGEAYAGQTFALPVPTGEVDVADVATVSVQGTWDYAYLGHSLMLDADGDGLADDLVATATSSTAGAGTDEPWGVLGVFLDVTPGVHAFTDASYTLPARTDYGESQIAGGPNYLQLDAVEPVLWIGCPSASYVHGLVERWDLPLSPTSEVYGGLEGPAGSDLAADPRGGVWAGARGAGQLLYVSADLAELVNFVPDGVGEEYFGASPALVQTAGGQIIMAVGVQGGERDCSDTAVYLCEITDGFDADDCERYTTAEGACSGSVQALVETADGLYLASSGWLLGSAAGKGLEIWHMPGA